MVTGNEGKGIDNWWVDRCPASDCRRTHVGRGYRGPNIDNFHYYTQCRSAKAGDLRIIRTTGKVRASPTEGPKAIWNEIRPDDLLAPGTILWLSPRAQVHWERRIISQEQGTIKAKDTDQKLQIEPDSIKPLPLIEP